MASLPIALSGGRSNPPPQHRRSSQPPIRWRKKPDNFDFLNNSHSPARFGGLGPGWLLGLAALFVSTYSLLAQSPATAADASESGRANVGVLTDNPPFSYRDNDGRITGFSVDLLSAVEQVMGLQLQRTEGTTEEINRAFLDRRLGMLQSFAQSSTRESLADFSVPYLTMQGAIFMRHGSVRLHSLADLRGKKVMVHTGSLGEELLRKAGLESSIVLVSSIQESLRRLDAGENDAVLVSRLTGLATAHELKLDRVIPVSDPIPEYNVRYCFAVQEGNKFLLAQLNEGLAILQRTGEFERIYQQWFSKLDPPPGYSKLAIISAIAGGLALALVVALAAVARERALHRQIAQNVRDLHASEERYRSLFESSREGLLILEPSTDSAGDYRVLQVNAAAKRLAACSDAAQKEVLLSRRLPGQPEVFARVVELITKNPDGSFEYQTLASPPRWLRVAVTPVDSRLLLSLTDVTDARSADERLRKSEEAIRQAQKLEAIGTLASGIAHDFNNILTSIIGNAELARLELSDKPIAQVPLREISTAGERATRLVRQILTFSRRTESRPENLLLHTVIDEALRFLRSTLPSSIDLRYERLADAPFIHGDPTQLHQVIMNLCTNAAHAIGSQPGTIQLGEETVVAGADLIAQHPELLPGTYSRLSVRDTGHGMPPEVIRRIFEPFYSTKPPGKGTGLGLSVVHGIVESHGGAITVYSKPGSGTVFHIYLPVAQSLPSISRSTPSTATPQGMGQHVLLVDDELPVVKVASQILTRLGYRVTSFEDSRKALEAFQQTPDAFDVIVTDLTMPQLSGLDLAEQVRRRKPQLPIVLASGFLNEIDVQRSRACAIDQLVEKPFTTASIALAVAAALSRASST